MQQVCVYCHHTNVPVVHYVTMVATSLDERHFQFLYNFRRLPMYMQSVIDWNVMWYMRMIQWSASEFTYFLTLDKVCL